MNKIKKIFLNKGSSIAYAIITAIFTIVPEECFRLVQINQKLSATQTIIVNRFILCVVIFIISSLFYRRHIKKRKKVFVSGNNFTIQIEYGNIFDYTDGKKVIDFDECFSTKVGEAPSDIKPNSVCGQYLKKYPISNIQGLIERAGVNPAKGKSRFNNQLRYEPGTLVPNDDYLLMAFARLDQNGLGYMSYGDYIKCLNTLWEQIDLYHGTSDVYLPILGSKITRFDKELSQQELLDIIICSYMMLCKVSLSNYIMLHPRVGFLPFPYHADLIEQELVSK